MIDRGVSPGQLDLRTTSACGVGPRSNIRMRSTHRAFAGGRRRTGGQSSRSRRSRSARSAWVTGNL